MNPTLRTGATVVAAAALLLLGACGAKPDAAAANASANPSSTTATATPSVLTVEVTSPSAQNWPQTLSANGALAAWQEIIVSPETGGLRIAELLVEVGARVKRGQLLARLADESLQNDLHKQQATVAQAQASLEQAVYNVQRSKQVENTGGLSAQTIKQYRITEATARATLASAQADLAAVQLQLRQTRITAPDDGLVATRSGVLGHVVSAGTELLRLVRQGRVEWQAEVDARQLAQVQPGQPEPAFRAGSDGPSALGWAGAQHQHRAGAGLRQPAARECGARGHVRQWPHRAPATPALTLPQTALVSRDGRDLVYLVGADRKVKSVVVSVGRRQQQRVEILSGVAAGAQVVAAGGAFLSEGATVTVSAAAPAAASATSR